jgi:hypothetical protein
MKKTLSVIPRNYRICFFLILLIKLLPVNIAGQKLLSYNAEINFRATFGEKYDDALQFINENLWIKDSLSRNGFNPEFAIAVVFPELIRYSSIQNYIEVSGLLTLYTQYGEKYADFSVGRFQMKPSFVEKLEKDLTSFSSETSILFDLSNTCDARTKRVNRLNDILWQVSYLQIFLKVMEEKYHLIQWKCEEDKLKFYATAYNTGYTSGEEKIKDRIGATKFYISLLKNDSCYSYSDIAWEYYQSSKY